MRRVVGVSPSSNPEHPTHSPGENEMKYKIVLEESEEGFAVSVPALPGCHSQGATEQEALENIADAIRDYLAALNDRIRQSNVREVEVEVEV
jgi:predicted RNase H-like HicB family nuclease